MPSLSTIHSNLRYFPEVIPTCTNMSYHIVKKSKFIIFLFLVKDAVKIVQMFFSSAKEMGCGEKMQEEQKIMQKVLP